MWIRIAHHHEHVSDALPLPSVLISPLTVTVDCETPGKHPYKTILHQNSPFHEKKIINLNEFERGHCTPGPTLSGQGATQVGILPAKKPGYAPVICTIVSWSQCNVERNVTECNVESGNFCKFYLLNELAVF